MGIVPMPWPCEVGPSGETTSFTIIPDSGYRIDSVTGCGGSLASDIYTTGPITANCKVTATFAPISHTLSVTVTGDGTVHSSPGSDIGCTGGCGQAYIQGTTVTLTAEPASGYRFDGWFGACTGTVDCTVTMDAAKSVGATFTNLFPAAPGTVTPSVATGGNHTVALKGDGTVWTWGANWEGQLGDGTTTSRPSPAQVPGLSDVAAIAAGYSHSVAVKRDGTVWVWGGNYTGQLGDGTTTSRPSPAQVPGLSDVTAIAAGNYHTLAHQSDGTVWNWGANWEGQLGDGTTTSRYWPVPVPGLSDVTAVAAGGFHTLALQSDGTVWTWGGNLHGELGFDPGWTPRQTPINLGSVVTTYTVTPSAGSNGSISPSTLQTVPSGDIASFTLTPDSGYRIDSVTGCGGSLVGDLFTTGPITADCTVTAIFAPLTHMLGVNVIGQGTVHSVPGNDIQCTGSCSQEFLEGTVVILTATLDSNYDFTGWSGECAGTGDCIVTMDAAKNVTATFTVNNTSYPVVLKGTQGTFTTVQTAYDSIPHGQSETMKLKAGDQGITNLFFDRNVTVIFEGGYDGSFQNIISVTTMSGTFTISDGQATISGVIIK